MVKWGERDYNGVESKSTPLLETAAQTNREAT